MDLLKRKLARSELGKAMLPCLGAFGVVAVLTAVLNVLYLSGSLYMMEVYDRVLPSRSGQTLLGLTVIVVFVYAFQAVMDAIRVRMLVRIGIIFDATLRPRVFNALLRLPLTRPLPDDPLAPLHDADSIRNFIGGVGLATLFDLPWIPFYLVICFLFHPLIGFTALAGAIIIVTMAIIGEANSRHYNEQSRREGMRRAEMTMAAVTNAETVKAMGMQPALERLHDDVYSRYIASFRKTGDIIGGMAAGTKVFRMTLQSIVLGVGAYLVINEAATAGVIIASSILSSRALAPVEMATANWRSMNAARASWVRLDRLFRQLPRERQRLKLPPPESTLSVQGVSAGPPGSRRETISDVSFELNAGAGLGIVGSSASGKSTLVRAIVGAWPVLRGQVRFDGAALDNWPSDDIGRNIGYMPQMVDLFAGTVAQNICRFDPAATPEMIVKAATAAGVHRMILDMPDGYETQIGLNGLNLSAGQRQCIGLARALYGDPFLVVLDEPNANLDGDGEDALIKACRSIRMRGGILIIVAHQFAALTPVDRILIMSRGKMMGMGDKNDFIRQQTARKNAVSGSQPITQLSAHEPPSGSNGSRLPEASQ